MEGDRLAWAKEHARDFELGKEYTLWCLGSDYDSGTITCTYVGIRYEDGELAHSFFSGEGAQFTSSYLLGENCFLTRDEAFDHRIGVLQAAIDWLRGEIARDPEDYLVQRLAQEERELAWCQEAKERGD